MGRKILVIDASLTVRKQVTSILNQAGCDTVEAESLSEVKAAVEEYKDLAAILTGFDVKGCLPQDLPKHLEGFASPRLPLILMFSSDRDVHFCDWIARNSIAGCVQKPIAEDNLVHVVNRVLGR